MRLLPTKRGFLSLAWLVVAAAAADAQCYQFSGSGATLQINITSILIQTPNSLPGGGYLTSIAFSSNNTFTAGGSTFTSQAMDDAEGTLQYTPPTGGIPGYTNLHLIVPTNQQDTLTDSYNWQITLFGAGNLIPSGTLPQVLPTISQWVFETAEEVIGTVSGPASNPATALYNVTSVTSCNSGSTMPPPTTSATSPGQDLGDPSSLPGDCGCGEPVNVGTGNLYYEALDYHTAGPNQLRFTRSYNSLGSASGTTLATTLGTNWRSNYDRYLQLSSSSSVIAERPNGQQVTFTLNGSTWTTDTDIDLALTNSGSTWTLTDHSDNVETYTSFGTQANLQSIQARNGYTQTMQYNGGGQLASVTDSFHRQLTLDYNNGLLQNVVTPDGLELSYGFTSGVLTSVTYSTSPPTSQQYVYGNSSFPAALTEIIDENGANYTSWTYDSTGRALTGQRGSGAGLITIVYNDSDGSRAVTNALGETETYKFTTLQSVPKVTEVDRQANSAVPAATSTYTYDSNGYTASHTDWNGNVTMYVNDVHGQPTSMTEAAGTPQARTTAITYLSNFHLPSQIVTPGLTASFTYDSKGELLTKTLTDTTGNSIPYSTNGQTRTWTFTWSNSLLASQQTPRTDVTGLTKLAYDATGALTSITNALGQTMQISKHLPGGLPETVVDPNGVTTNLSYDSRQRLIGTAVTTAAGVLTTTYSRDAAGNVTGAILPDGSGLTATYDAAHRMRGIQDLFNQQMQLTLDGLGDVTQTTWIGANGATERSHSGVFDVLGRILEDVGGVNQTTSFTYDADGNAITVIDPLNHKTQKTFDVLNRLSGITDAAGGAQGWSYDAHNRVLAATDPTGGTTVYVYDGFGGVLQQTSPASGTTVYRYDGDGNLVQRVDARGVTVNAAFDALDRLTSVTYPGGSTENVSYTYDQSGHGFGIGRLTSLSDAGGTLSKTYDERGNELTETRVLSGATLKTSYSYDAVSRLLSITYPSGTAVSYTRDKMGRVTAASAKLAGASAAQPVISNIGYQPFGPVTTLTFGNGIAETRSYDQDYRLTKVAGVGSSTVQSLTYGYDTANNVLSIADGVTAANAQNLGYDALNRLASASGGYGSLAYSYDANGNRTKEGSPPAAMDGLGTVTAFSYNQAGRLASAAQGTQQVAQYTYDALGQRLVKQGSTTTIYLYDQQGKLLEEANGQGNAQADYIYLEGRPVAMIAQSTGAALYFLHSDRLGTPQLATDKNQNSAWTGNYLPFGGLNPATSQTATLAQDLRLPGQIADIETGLYQNGFRYYGAAWGRYSQSDPIGLGAGLNTYAYALGNPLIYADPWGLCSVTDAYNALAQALSQAGTSIEQFAQNQYQYEQQYGLSQFAQYDAQQTEQWAQQEWQQYGPTATELYDIYGFFKDVAALAEEDVMAEVNVALAALKGIVGPVSTETIDWKAGTTTITRPDGTSFTITNGK